jgi:hypothetical protein
MKNTLYPGLDVHKDSIMIAIAMGAQRGSAPLWAISHINETKLSHRWREPAWLEVKVV